jgi:hypothetical protein
MILDCVVAACNYNELYYDLIPLFIKAWTKLYPLVDIKIIFIHDCIPDFLLEYEKYIILFKPLPKISTAFISQYIRNLYPCILDYKNGILITDIDMLPMNSVYFTKNIENIDDDKFIYLRHDLLNVNEIAMCYNVALNKTWREIFNIHNINDMINRLYEVNNNIVYVDGHGKSGWNTDQLHLYNYVMEWNKKTNNFIYFHDNYTNYKRLDRIFFNTLNHQLIHSIKNGYYSSYHVHRPYSKYKELNDAIINLL